MTPSSSAMLAGTVVLLGLMSCGARGEPDEAALGKAQGYPPGTAETMYADAFKVGSFSATDKIFPTRAVPHGQSVAPLENHSGTKITYRHNSADCTLDDYLNHQRVTGLLVLKGNQIIAERYGYGRSEKHRFISYSMAKSVQSTLIGIAQDKGIIVSLDDPAEKYVAELKGSAYGKTSIRQLLRMSSGVKFVEKYDGIDDMARLNRAQVFKGGETALHVLASLNDRISPAGEKFEYSSAETTVLGYVLTRAAGRDIATLTSEWLWRPMGAESDAGWNFAIDGVEKTAGGFNATLRDYGRFGMLLANDGKRGDMQIIPRDYLIEATDVSRQPPAFQPHVATTYFGYGYQFWLYPMRSRTFALLGIYGQSTHVQPESKIVMVRLGVDADPIMNQDAALERDELWRGILKTLGGSGDP